MKASKVYTICKIDHAGGLLAQTIPALSIGAHVVIEPFNAFRFCREIGKYTHTHITPGHARLIMKTKGLVKSMLVGLCSLCVLTGLLLVILKAFLFEVHAEGAFHLISWPLFILVCMKLGDSMYKAI